MNAEYDCNNVYSVFCDDLKSMQTVTNRMITSGHEDILYLYNSHSASAKRKLDGFIAGLNSCSLPVREEYLCFYDGSHEDIEEMVSFIQRAADSGLHFNGIIASEDALGVAAVKYANRAGMRIPEELSIIGYNNSLLAKCCDPELSTVDNQIETLCKALVRILISVLNGEHAPQKSVFSGELVERGTTGH